MATLTQPRPTAGAFRRDGMGWRHPGRNRAGRHRAPALPPVWRRRARAQAKRERAVLQHIALQRSQSRPPTRGVSTPLSRNWRRGQDRRERAVLAYVNDQRNPTQRTQPKDPGLGWSLYRRTNEGVRASSLHRGTDKDHFKQQAKTPVPKGHKPVPRFGSKVIWPQGQEMRRRGGSYAHSGSRVMQRDWIGYGQPQTSRTNSAVADAQQTGGRSGRAVTNGSNNGVAANTSRTGRAGDPIPADSRPANMPDLDKVGAGMAAGAATGVPFLGFAAGALAGNNGKSTGGTGMSTIEDAHQQQTDVNKEVADVRNAAAQLDKEIDDVLQAQQNVAGGSNNDEADEQRRLLEEAKQFLEDFLKALGGAEDSGSKLPGMW